jgi:hypothetical protein
MMWWIAVTVKNDKEYTADQANPGQKVQEEMAVLLISALLQAFLYVIVAVYVLDNSEFVAKRLEAAAPRAPADMGAYQRAARPNV